MQGGLVLRTLTRTRTLSLTLTLILNLSRTLTLTQARRARTLRRPIGMGSNSIPMDARDDHAERPHQATTLALAVAVALAQALSPSPSPSPNSSPSPNPNPNPNPNPTLARLLRADGQQEAVALQPRHVCRRGGHGHR